MRIPVVRDRDWTTTGGRVIALGATIHNQGKKLALHGEHATCRNCKGSWPMRGTGEKMRNRGTHVVIDGDRVLCPCGKNWVIAGADARYFIHKDPTASKVTTTTDSSRELAQIAPYDEQFTLLDDAHRPLANVRYRIVIDGKRMITGTTDAQGKTERIKTDTASKLKLYTTG